MKKDSFVPKGIHFDKKLDDGFLNLYEEGIFVRCFEYSAVFISEITGYRLFVNIDKKAGFIFLELGFPTNKLQDVLSELERRKYFIRLTEKSGELDVSIGNIKVERDKNKLVELKQKLIKF